MLHDLYVKSPVHLCNEMHICWRLDLCVASPSTQRRQLKVSHKSSMLFHQPTAEWTHHGDERRSRRAFPSCICRARSREVCVLGLICPPWSHMGSRHRWGDPRPLYGAARGLPVQTSRLLPLLGASLRDGQGDMTVRLWMLTLRANSKHQPNAKQTKAKQVKSSYTISVMSSCQCVSPCRLKASVVSVLI